MGRFTPPSTPRHAPSPINSSKRLAVGLAESIAYFCVLWTKRATKATKRVVNSGSPKKASMAKPKRFLATISNKATNLRHKKKAADDDDGDQRGGHGDGGLWQRSILMGDKCQPLDFSGVIYYDNDGKRLSELPMKSPRASPMPNYLYAKREV